MSQVPPDPDEPEGVYATLRPLLISIAYEMVGAVGEAEDIVQEAFLRFHRAGEAGTAIQSPRAWLSTVVTRLDLLTLAHWTLRSAWTICARVARKMRLLMLALCAITISACGRLPATVPAGVDSREA